MSEAETLEYLKRQVRRSIGGASQDQRERWYLIRSIHSLHIKIDRLLMALDDKEVEE